MMKRYTISKYINIGENGSFSVFIWSRMPFSNRKRVFHYKTKLHIIMNASKKRGARSGNTASNANYI
jgi:hypothetical protein